MEKDLFGICPYTTAQRILQGKWTMLILFQLSQGTLRFNELQRRMPSMTHATLSRQLRQLEEDGLIIRTVYSEIPPKVEYTLSPLGQAFQPVLTQLEIWGKSYIQHLADRNEATNV